jgi:hypothetical protein
MTPFFPLYPPDYLPLHGEWQKRGGFATVGEVHAAHPGHGVGCHMRSAGIIAIDLDRKNGVDGTKTLVDLERRFGELPPTRVHSTRSGGLHYFYRAPGVDRNSAGRIRRTGEAAPGFDVRAGDGFVRWIGTPGFALVRKLPIVELPTSWREALSDAPGAPRERVELTGGPVERRRACGALLWAGEQVANAGRGARNGDLHRYARWMAQRFCPPLSYREIEAVMLQACAENGLAKDDGERKCIASIRSGFQWGSQHRRSA